MKKRKNIRLDRASYIGRRAYSITACTHNRKSLLTREDFPEKIVDILKDVTMSDFDVYVYTIMPDHIHFLLVGVTDIADLAKTMKLFKQKTGYQFKQFYGERLWQRDYYDHALREEESLEAVAWYIINNPVAAGFVEDPFNYAFTGSFVYDDLRFLDPEWAG